MPQPGFARSTEQLKHESARRRTFAIISHPDAGKTTLTEKLLLYTNAVELAGAVRARKQQPHVVSDWMSLERERGISVTVSALEMEYRGLRLNLLDTPGHQDFSEDTYRTLMAVDSAVMVLDSARGIEAQTEKLFQVCRHRQLPILTFINKMDHAGRPPLELLDEIERLLGITAAPMNWPIGSGTTFQGVYDIPGRHVWRFQRLAHGQQKVPVIAADLEDPAISALLGQEAYTALREEVALLHGAGTPFDHDSFLRGELTPVFFGSALNNFGVEPFLEALLALAPPPQARQSNVGVVQPTDATFTGFVFKIQANMDLKHRDRMAFLRVCSGRFEKDMGVYHPRLGRTIRLSRAYRLFGKERITVDEAYAGDVIGVINPGLFVIGDTVTSGTPCTFPPMPHFCPEHFGMLRNDDVARYKQFTKGVAQLEEEGAVQVLFELESPRKEPILAVVGELQFDAARARLRDEYRVQTRLERLPYVCARWLQTDGQALGDMVWPTYGVMRCQDRDGRLVALFSSAWELGYFQEKNPAIGVNEVAWARQ